MKRINDFILFLGILIVLTGLGYFAYQGFYNRYWSDDWCYNNDFSSLGVLKTTGLYFATGEEASRGWPLNRHAMTLFWGIAYLPGVAGTQFLAAITLGIWWASLNWVLSNLVKIKSLGIPKSLIFLSSGIILYYTLYISTDRFQIL